jgi:hypothetical protein
MLDAQAGGWDTAAKGVFMARPSISLAFVQAFSAALDVRVHSVVRLQPLSDAR